MVEASKFPASVDLGGDKIYNKQNVLLTRKLTYLKERVGAS